MAEHRIEHTTPYTIKTHYWHHLGDGRVQCDLCPRHCHLHEGQRGLCFVRGCLNGEVVLTSYGLSSGFCIDPIEKKPLNHFYPGTPVLSFGTAGCNLACKFCQNWDMSKSREVATLSQSASPKALVEAAKAMNCRHIAFTYNDPIIFMEYAIDVAKQSRQQGIHTVAVTAGYIDPQPREVFFRHMDAVNIDLKAFSEDFYRDLCGGSLAVTLDTLKYVKHQTDCWLEVTTLLIPGHNDSDQEIEKLCQWLVTELGCEVPLHFSAFHPDWKMQDVPATPAATLKAARSIALHCGLQYVYTGNVHDSQGGSTYCPGCGTMIIERDWYQLGHWGLDSSGHCKQCGHTIAGCFDAEPGNWGPRRQPVKLRTGF